MSWRSVFARIHGKTFVRHSRISIRTGSRISYMFTKCIANTLRNTFTNTFRTTSTTTLKNTLRSPVSAREAKGFHAIPPRVHDVFAKICVKVLVEGVRKYTIMYSMYLYTYIYIYIVYLTLFIQKYHMWYIHLYVMTNSVRTALRKDIRKTFTDKHSHGFADIINAHKMNRKHLYEHVYEHLHNHLHDHLYEHVAEPRQRSLNDGLWCNTATCSRRIRKDMRKGARRRSSYTYNNVYNVYIYIYIL